MKIVWYLLTFLFGFFGVASLLRAAEVLFTGHGLNLMQVLIGIIGLMLAVMCLKKARAA